MFWLVNRVCLVTHGTASVVSQCVVNTLLAGICMCWMLVGINWRWWWWGWRCNEMLCCVLGFWEWYNARVPSQSVWDAHHLSHFCAQSRNHSSVRWLGLRLNIPVERFFLYWINKYIKVKKKIHLHLIASEWNPCLQVSAVESDLI